MSEEKKSGTHIETIHLPAPTAWPIVMAFGVTMGFLGLVTNSGVTCSASFWRLQEPWAGFDRCCRTKRTKIFLWLSKTL